MQCPAQADGCQDPVLFSTLDKKAKINMWAMASRQSNPGMACFTEADLLDGFTPNTAPLFADPVANPVDPTPTRTERSVRCATQAANANADELFLGKYQDTLYIWENGSTINWTARADGYLSPDDALRAARACYTAAEAWNKVLDGRVQFVYVESLDIACFQVKYGGVHPHNVLAKGFTPDLYEIPVNNVIVYQGALEGKYKDQMENTIAHELGHVLGLRHEHSQDEPKGFFDPKREDGSQGLESIMFGSRNPFSIMAYYDAMKIQDTDVKDVRAAYDNLQNGSVVYGPGLELGKNVTLDKKVYRVKPDN